MLRKLYDWTIAFADTRYALLALAIVAFAESSFFPIPPEVLLIPMIVAIPHRAWLIAGVCTLSSVAGGAFGYYIGAELFDAVAQPILEFYHKADKFDEFAARYNDAGHWAVLFGGLSPFPYKVITITSGATGLNFMAFMTWSLVARAVRYFIIAALLYKFGTPIRTFIERYLGWVFLAFLAVLVGGFAMIKYV